ncbi:MAG: hypothetical protein HGA82_02240, partial [Anaerolineales bacterium]|nr:hypothetical protein [Anaerolineales bacterium]
MLFRLLYSLHDVIKPLNVFRYLTFRMMIAMLTSLLLALFLGPKVIEALKKLRVGQTIRDDGPQTHKKKAGTPTMGGALILLALVISTIAWADPAAITTWIVIGVTLGFRLVEVAEGLAVFEAEAGPWAYNPIGSVHGGWYAAVLDAPLGVALHTTLPRGVGYTTLELKVNLVRPVRPDTGVLRAVGARSQTILGIFVMEGLLQGLLSWCMAVPLSIRGAILGVLNVECAEANALSADDLQLVSILATSASVAIENARLYRQAQQEVAERIPTEDALQRRNRELALLVNAVQMLSSTLDLDKVLERVVEAAVFIANQERTHWHDQALWFVPTEKFKWESMTRRGKPSFAALVSDPEKARLNLFARDMLLADYYRQQVPSYGYTLLEVDGSHSADEMTDLAEAHFAQ